MVHVMKNTNITDTSMGANKSHPLYWKWHWIFIHQRVKKSDVFKIQKSLDPVTGQSHITLYQND
jgi:hypothetical protein